MLITRRNFVNFFTDTTQLLLIHYMIESLMYTAPIYIINVEGLIFMIFYDVSKPGTIATCTLYLV